MSGVRFVSFPRELEEFQIPRPDFLKENWEPFPLDIKTGEIGELTLGVNYIISEEQQTIKIKCDETVMKFLATNWIEFFFSDYRARGTEKIRSDVNYFLYEEEIPTSSFFSSDIMAEESRYLGFWDFRDGRVGFSGGNFTFGEGCFANRFVYGYSEMSAPAYYEKRTMYREGKISEKELDLFRKEEDAKARQLFRNFINKQLNVGEFIEIYDTWTDHLPNQHFKSPTSEETMTLDEILVTDKAFLYNAGPGFSHDEGGGHKITIYKTSG